ncbi:unnamed protein product [Closterium sp. NIES-64]|nr:unnamed protein product [Closterium sp. NIES-64]
MPSGRVRPAAPYLRMPICLVLVHAPLPSARARPGAQRQPRSAARALAHPAAQSQRAPRSSAPARAPLPSTRARPAALRPRVPHYPRAVHTLLPCAPHARPAARVPRTPCCPARLAYAAAATKLLLPLAKEHHTLPREHCCPAVLPAICPAALPALLAPLQPAAALLHCCRLRCCPA